MVILFDLLCSQPSFTSKFHGGGEYTKRVFEAVINNIESAGNKLEVCLDSNKFIDDWILNAITKKHIKIHDVQTNSDIYQVLLRLSEDHKVRFFSGIGYGYGRSNYPFPKSIESIGVFHGLRMQEKPYDIQALRYGPIKGRVVEFIRWTLLKGYSKRKVYMQNKDALENFDTLITVSKHSEYSIRLNFKDVVQDKRLYTLYTPLKYLPSNVESCSENNERFIMIVSANRWIKNSYRGIVSIDGLYSFGFMSEVKTRVYGSLPDGIKKKIKNKNMFEFYDYVTTEQLEQAYHDCEIFFYPTLNEGFGLPPIEAMKYKKTCVISGVCSLPEVYGDAVYYCNPYDIMEMQNRILQALDNKISTNVIEKRVEEIIKKQESDLSVLCRYIID